MNLLSGEAARPFHLRDTTEPRAAPAKEALRIRLYGIMLLSDMASIIAGFVFANVIRIGDALSYHGINMIAALLPVFLLSGIQGGAYSLGVLTSRRTSIARVMRSLFFSGAVALGLVFYLQAGHDFSRIVFTVGITVSLILLICERLGLDVLTRRWLGGFATSEILLLDGVDLVPAKGVIALDVAACGLAPSATDPIMLDRIGRLLRHADRVGVACPAERRAAWATALKGMHIPAEILAPELLELGSLAFGEFSALPTIKVAVGPLALRQRVMKRALDLGFVLAVLPVVAPLMLALAILIRLESPGPAFFVQNRIGRGNRLFRLYKFRSMRIDALDHDASQLTRRVDDRVTRIGGFMRRTSLDELPQLLNVLRGEMSVAGPRPHPLGATAGTLLYWDIDQRYWHRHAVKPGLTGLAQIRGYRGTTFQELDLTNRLQSDLEYLSGWTLWRDIWIILSTARVLMHRNAF